MKCNGCKHLVVDIFEGYHIDRCEKGNGITWDRYGKQYESSGYCRWMEQK